MCRVLQVSASGFYKWRKDSNVSGSDDEKFKELICNLHKRSYGSYGARRITKGLREQGFVVNIKRIRRLMRELGISGKGEPKRFVKTTDSNHNNPVAPNYLCRKFTVDEPNTHWVSDITYIWTEESWAYLAVVLDLFSRKVVGWSLSKTIDENLVCLALECAMVKRRPLSGLILHSDRGGQYTSKKYQEFVKKHGIVQSMSRKGNCWDNAVVERFFRSLKVERIHGTKIQSFSQAYRIISDYIDEFYNNNRIHSYLLYKTPSQWELEATGNKFLVSRRNRYILKITDSSNYSVHF